MRMARHIVVVCLTLVLLYVGTALGGTNLNALEQEVKETTNYIEQEIISLDDDLEQNERSSLKSIDDMDPSERFFFTSNALNFGNNGATSVTIGNAGYVVLGAYILVPLIIGLALLFYLIGGHGDRGGYSEPYGSTGTTYGHDSYSRSFDPYAIDWEKFSILDWISIGEEAWRKFDPADLDCQKRLICEIHQNTSRFGVAASKMVDLFSYLQYAEVLSLPDEFKALVEEYLDAADRGRSIQKDCGEIYNSCEFSVKSMVDKFSHNEI